MRKLATGILVLLLSLALPAGAELRSDRMQMPNELRIGWGDQQFEHLVFRPSNSPTTLPESFHFEYKENFHYAQHFFLEYQRRHNTWFGYGVMLDCSGVEWDKVVRDGMRNELSREKHQHVWNVVVMTMLRFTYLHTEYVSLYSGLGVGFGVNGGTELDWKTDKKVVGGLALQPTVIGVTVGHGHIFASAELGGMYSVRDKNTVFLAGSKVVSIALGVTF